MGLVSTQAFAASVTVTAQPIQNAGTDGAITYSSDYSGASSVITRHESSDLTLNVSDQITAVTVQGNKASGSGDVKVDLLDSSATIVDTATVAIPAASGAYSQLVTMTLGTAAYSSIATVSAAYTSSSVPIAFNAASGSNGKTNSLTWSHTVGAGGSNRVLVVGVSFNSNVAASGVTYAGQPLTLIGAQNTTGGRVELWYRVAPATGANNVVVSLPSSLHVMGGATSWTGVHQTTPLGTAASSSGTGTTASVSVTSAAGEVVVDTLWEGGITPAAGSGQTERWSLAQGGMRGAGSSKDGATSTTMSWTFGSADWAIVAVPLKQASP